MMELVDKADIGAPDPGTGNVGQMRGRDRINIDFTGVRRFEQSGDVE